jgi:hypothetical protein
MKLFIEWYPKIYFSWALWKSPLHKFMYFGMIMKTLDAPSDQMADCFFCYIDALIGLSMLLALPVTLEVMSNIWKEQEINRRREECQLFVNQRLSQIQQR